jgi:outer membrane protein assembly factor BamA
MPWGSLSRHLAHHTVALHAGGGAAGGQLPGGTAFYVGGFVEPSLFDTIRNYIVQGGFVLRGYPTGVQGGSNYALLNAEYRFPILNLDRGPSTVPLLLNRIVGNGFVDVGGAFNDVHRANLLVGVGAELWFEMQLGYFLAFNFRLGYARGLSTGGIDKVYFVASVPY